MSQGIRIGVSCVLFAVSAAVARGQAAPAESALKNEVGLVLGATETPAVGLVRGGSVNHNSSLALGAEYDRRITGRRWAVYAGVGFLASPFDVKTSYPPVDVSPQYAYTFLTPHVKVKLRPDAALAPWLEFGGGYANFAPSQPRVSTVKVTGDGVTGTFAFGGGVDTRPLVHLKGVPIVKNIPIGARVEVRDFYSGQPHYGLATTSSRQNNVVFTGGLLLRF